MHMYMYLKSSVQAWHECMYALARESVSDNVSRSEYHDEEGHTQHFENGQDNIDARNAELCTA